VTGEPIDPRVVQPAGPMFDLARGGHTDEVAASVDAGAPADLTNDEGDTPLILAACHGHPGTVGATLARGADHFRADDREPTALAAAVLRQSADTASMLLAVAADPDAGGPSARATAMSFELPAMVELLDRPR